MNNDVVTIPLQTEAPRLYTSTAETLGESNAQRPETPNLIDLVKQAALGVFLSIALPSSTALPDYWFYERKRRDLLTTVSIVQRRIGYPISRAEALHIARTILEHAERERMDLANLEASRGIQWDQHDDL